MTGQVILIVGPLGETRDNLTRVIRTHYPVEACATVDEALAWAESRLPELVILGPDADTPQFLERWRATSRTHAISVLVVTGVGAAEPDLAALAADDCLHLPVADGQLLTRVRILLRLREAEETLVEDGRRRDHFLATLAHELRNPLAPICNALEILRTPEASAVDVIYARDLLERQVRQMVRLIDDLLDVSRLRVGRIELKRERVTLDTVVNAALETCRPAFDASDQELTVSLPPQQVVLDADSLRLAQVLANLLHNAAKYTGPKGQIALTAQVEGKHVILQVRDTGIGIRDEQLPFVFDMFRQKAAASAGVRGGLGIGLGLVKALVEQHGGSVTAASAGPGTGSEFSVRLPLADEQVPVPAPEVISAPPPPPEVRRVLVVDDSVDAVRSLARLLSLSGNEVRTAHDGAAALDVFQEFRPEVVVLDIGMPRMNGYEVAQRIRRMRNTGPVLLIALTGWGQAEDRRRSREAGFDIHLVKPVEPEQLRDLLARGVEVGVPS